MKKKILIIGSTGTLGSRLLSFSKKNEQRSETCGASKNMEAICLKKKQP